MCRFLLVWKLLGILPLVILCSPVARGQVPEETSLEEHRQARRELAQRRRRIIMNNDGCDVLYFPNDETATVETFLSKRTTPLAGTHVDAIAFCPTSSGFSFFTHNTKVGSLLTRSGREYGIQPNTRNIAQELIDQGTDCLQAVVAFGHEHNMEVFWSMRMNDTHDVSHHPENPYLLFPPLKEAHPDWLVGDHVKRTPHGRWSSVDYSHPEIRDLACGFIEEVCHDYDVDGVELDFFRHLCFFKSTATGGAASDDERNIMTRFMRRVRRMTEDVGMKRGRPILVAIRVPDSTGFCRDMGLALEQWMREGLIDILITTGYFRLNPWQYSVELGHKHRVQVYPCLSDSRVRGETRFRRSSGASYRGRAMNAWTAGADGLHLFNHFNPHDPMWSEIGDPDALLVTDKLYFVNVRDGDPRGYLANGREHRTVALVGPSNHRLVTAGEPVNLEVEIGDDLPAAQRRGYKPEVTLHLEIPSVNRAEQLDVELNGTQLTGGLLSEGWIDFCVPASSLKQGTNEVKIVASPSALRPDEWSATFDDPDQPSRTWNRDRGSAHAVAEVVNDTLLIADRGEAPGDYLYYRYPWGADPDGEAVMEARAKVESGSSYIIVTNGIGGERVGLWPDRIELFHDRSIQHKMDTTDDFHVYRIELKARDLKVYVDGELRMDAPAAMEPRPGYARNEVAFGAANSPQQGTAYWRDVRARASGLTLRDLAVSVKYDKE